MSYPELKGKCLTCLGCNRLENADFVGCNVCANYVKRKEYSIRLYITNKEKFRNRRTNEIMNKIEFEILGKPIGKGRPRVGKWGTYTPKPTANYETLVKFTFSNLFPDFEIMKKPIKAEITAVFTVPKSYSKKQIAEIEKKPVYTKKPDCDNIAKIILDSLNGLAYNDDNQIYNLKVIKRYGNQEKVIVNLEEV